MPRSLRALCALAVMQGLSCQATAPAASANAIAAPMPCPTGAAASAKPSAVPSETIPDAGVDAFAPDAPSVVRPSRVSAAPPVYPEPDSDHSAPGESRARKRTAVLLFAPPSEVQDGLTVVGELGRVEALSFQPVLCVIEGKLESGLRCGEVMPPRVKVRVTGEGPGAQPTMDLARSRVSVRPSSSTVTYPPPYAPVCCMQNGCQGKTIPYRPVETPQALFTTRTILAVWPSDAEIELASLKPGDREHERLACALTIGGAPLRGCHNFPIATTDLDGDHREELLVYEESVNGYGLYVRVSGIDKPVYSYSCIEP